MLRQGLLAAVVAAAAVPAAWAQDPANCNDCKKPNFFERAWKDVCRDFKRNNCWPDPFVVYDRNSVRAPMAIMVANGWQVQNTLTDEHFVDEGAALSEAGKIKIETVLANTPSAYRTVFVLSNGRDGDLLAERIAAVQNEVALYSLEGPPAPVLASFRQPREASALYVDEVTRRYYATTPDPRLPETEGDEED